MSYEIKDSGARQTFDGGAMRDTEDGKLDWSNLFVHFEPMGTRFVTHMTKGRTKYPDPEPGIPNWSLFEATPETLARTERSLDRHYKAYRAGLTDEDHAAAILFNLNLAEKIREALRFASPSLAEWDQEPGMCLCGDTLEHDGQGPVQASFEDPQGTPI
jgi:hypothetical protein